jgi:hypothetical protein
MRDYVTMLFRELVSEYTGEKENLPCSKSKKTLEDASHLIVPKR